MGTDSQGIIFSLAAFESNTVNKAFKIDNCNVSVFHCSFHSYHSGVVFSLLVQICFHFFLCHSGIDLLHFNPFVFAQGHFRLKSHFCGKDKRLSGLNLCNINLRGGNDCFFAFFNSLLICLRDHFVGCILIKEFFSIHLLNHLAGHFALTETGNLNFSLIFLISLLNCSFQLFRRHFNGKLSHVFFQFFHL